MKKPISGKRVIYLVQVPGEETLLPAFQTEGTFSSEQEMVDEQTKSGRVVGYGSKSETFELTFYAGQGDAGQNAIQKAYDEELDLKIWRAELDKNKNEKHNARFGFTIIESIETSDPTDGFVEISVSLPVLGKTVTGELNPLPLDLIEAAETYDFEQAFPAEPIVP